MVCSCVNCQQLQDTATKNSLLGELDDHFVITDDKAYQLAHKACCQVTDTKSGSNKDVFSVLEHLGVVSLHVKGFVFEKVSVSAPKKEATWLAMDDSRYVS